MSSCSDFSPTLLPSLSPVSSQCQSLCPYNLSSSNYSTPFYFPFSNSYHFSVPVILSFFSIFVINCPSYVHKSLLALHLCLDILLSCSLGGNMNTTWRSRKWSWDRGMCMWLQHSFTATAKDSSLTQYPLLSNDTSSTSCLSNKQCPEQLIWNKVLSIVYKQNIGRPGYFSCWFFIPESITFCPHRNKMVWISLS